MFLNALRSFRVIFLGMMVVRFCFFIGFRIIVLCAKVTLYYELTNNLRLLVIYFAGR